VLFPLAAAGDSALERGAEALRRHDFAAAEAALTEAVREAPRNARAAKLLGMAYSAEEKYALAEEPLRRACTLDPAEAGACYFLGRLYYTINRFEESRTALETALAHNAGVRGQLLDGLALTLEALGDSAGAGSNYRAAARTGYRQAQIDYGMFLARHGDPRTALEWLRKAKATEQLARVEKELAASPPASTAGAAPPAALIRFEAHPLAMTVRNGARGDKHQVETMLAGVAVFDYDNDGWPDIYVANGADLASLEKTDPGYYNRLFHNNRDGTFTDVTVRAGVAGHGYSMGVAAGDYDNDGNVDLFVAGVRTNTMYRNRGDGTFEDVTARAGLASDGRWSIAAAWFDYDNDGLLDLFLVRYVEWDPASEPYCGPMKPGYRTYCHPRYYQPLPNALYHNEGGGRFRDVSRESGIGPQAGKGMSVAIGDYDGDGRPDVFVANDTVPNFLFHNLGGGRFEEVALRTGVAYNADGIAPSAMGADFCDYDNDGREDLFVTDLTNERFMLFRNSAPGQFTDVSDTSRIAALSLPWSGWSTGVFDFDNDGWKDLFAAGGNVMDNAELTSSRKSRQPNLMFVNRGGWFELQLLPGEALHRGAAFGDFDRDGRVDAVVTRLNEAPLVLLNVTATAHHWIALRLVGTGSNRDGLGAQVRVETHSGAQWNRATTSVGYGGASDRVVHFGLGEDPQVLSIGIQWPSGVRQVLRDVAADRYLTVEEPRPTAPLSLRRSTSSLLRAGAQRW
jgi:Tfp pilus assembly protein PilF